MNSNYGKSNNKSGSIGAFDFDLGLGSGSTKSLNDQKNKTSSYSSPAYSYTSTQSKPNTNSSWTHKPTIPSQSGGSGSLSGPTSMVGDIFGKSWSSGAPGVGVGVVHNKNPNLFGDLLNSAIGPNKSTGNVPLKNVSRGTNQSTTFSMGRVADSLPKNVDSSKFGGNSGGSNVNLGAKVNVNLGGNSNTSRNNLGGQSMKSMTGSGGIGSNKDPFGSLVDFSSKPTSKESDKSGFGKDPFGDFQNAPSEKSGSSFQSGAFPTSKTNDPIGDFGFPNISTQTQSQSQPSGQSAGNDFDYLFATPSDGGIKGNNAGFASDDWGLNSEFGGSNDDTGATTTEIEGLPPPPAGVSAPSAKSKGMDSYKQGQFADAIKYLSWAVVLLEKNGDGDGAMEVLTCRASCYKEVGEYKKAVADCTKMLDHDGKNVSVLVQRALLYESMEKYKLGAEDLRTVMKLDPANRVARSTIHRLTKMAG